MVEQYHEGYATKGLEALESLLVHELDKERDFLRDLVVKNPAILSTPTTKIRA